MRHFDLCIVGSGSGNSLIDERFDGLSVALVDKTSPFGGTCLNVGCIPTKMFVVPADLAASPPEAARVDVSLACAGADWPALRDRIFGRIDAISAGGLDWRRRSANVTVFTAEAEFVGAKKLRVGDETITAERIVLAAGSRATLPEVPGLDDPALRAALAARTVGTRPRGVHTSDTVMRIDSLPQSMIVLGGGFVAAEFAHVFASFGVQVSVLARSGLLRREDPDIAERFTAEFSRRVELITGDTLREVRVAADGRVTVVSSEREITAEVLLVATGRVPNGDTLNLSAAGIETTEGGYVVVDDQQRTTADGVWALGDVCSPWQLKHVANHEARVVQHNLLHPEDPRTSDHRFVPHAVFSHPQVASVGLTEAEAQARGIRYTSVLQEYASVAYGWAMNDEGHALKLLADPDTGLLLGAHCVGPQASTLLQPLIQAMSFGLDARAMARGQYWIHPALPELIENALLSLELA